MIFFSKITYSQKDLSNITLIDIPSNVAINGFINIGEDLYAIGHYTDNKTFVSEIRLFKSSDNGDTWSRIEPKGLDLLTGNSFFNSKGRLFTSGTSVLFPIEFSVYSSKDNGLSWNRVTNGIPSNVAINGFINIVEDLYAIGHYTDNKTFVSEIRLFKSSDNGDTWSSIDTEGLGLLTGNSFFNSRGELFISGTSVLYPIEFSVYNFSIE